VAKVGVSVLSIEPTLHVEPFGGAQSFGRDSLTISLIINNVSVVHQQVSFSNYVEVIDDALNRFIESQDEQFPLGPPKKAP
jgi:hypothetical protein